MTRDEVALWARSRELWPRGYYLPCEWVRAWGVVRSTQRGALLDAPVKGRPLSPFTVKENHHAPTLC